MVQDQADASTTMPTGKWNGWLNQDAVGDVLYVVFYLLLKGERMGVRHKSIETISGTKGGAHGRRHRASAESGGQRQKEQARSLSDPDAMCVCMLGAARSKAEDQKSVRVQTPTVGSEHEGDG